MMKELIPNLGRSKIKLSDYSINLLQTIKENYWKESPKFRDNLSNLKKRCEECELGFNDLLKDSDFQIYDNQENVIVFFKDVVIYNKQDKLYVPDKTMLKSFYETTSKLNKDIEYVKNEKDRQKKLKLIESLFPFSEIEDI